MMQLILKSYDKDILKIYSNYLLTDNSFFYKNRQVRLPKIKKKITLLRSPHVFKKSKDHYQQVIHTIIISLDKNVNLLNIIKNVPKSVFLKLKIEE